MRVVSCKKQQQEHLMCFKLSTNQYLIAFRQLCSFICSPLEKMLQDLQPLFKADSLLPRSIIASLNPAEIAEVVGKDFIPFEIFCASILFWVKSTAPKQYGYGTMVWFQEEQVLMFSFQETFLCSPKREVYSRRFVRLVRQITLKLLLGFKYNLGYR